VCHNANCAHATDPDQDSTLASLDDSLALEYLGRPAIDGIELDVVWDRVGARCVFAHDLEHPDPASALDAADRVATYLRGPREDVSWLGGAFFVKLETKGVVTAENDEITEDEIPLLHACLFDMYDRIKAAAVESGHPLELAFESSAPLVRGIESDVRWPGKEPETGVHVRLIANVQSPGLKPSDLASLRGDTSSDGIDILAYHFNRSPDGVGASFLVLEVKRMMWMLDVTIETFYAIDSYEPHYIVTNEAVVIRRWMEE
jgi:hypothetical protein